jgi:hypothetical protein
MILAMSSREGSRNESMGRGVKRLRPRRSAINAAFSLDFGRRKTDILEKRGTKEGGRGSRKLSRARECSKIFVIPRVGFGWKGLVGR